MTSWVKDKFAAISSSGGKGYQGPPGGRTRGTFGALDPDEAWDAVGAEADYGYSGNGATGGGGYEEQELGRVGKGYAQGGGLGSIETGRDEGDRARKAERDLEARYDEEMHGGNGTRGKVQNPFDDDAEEVSLRGVSPRPEDEGRRGHRSQGSAGGRFTEGV